MSKWWQTANLLLVWASLGCGTGARSDELFLNRVAPILETRCLGCHRGAAARGGLSLETAAGLARGGDSGPPVEPGNAAASWLLDLIAGDAPSMPQDDEPLSDEQVAVIRRWIETGVNWPEGVELTDRRSPSGWWSFRPLARPPLPEVSSSWIQNPIDAFVAAEHAAHGLQPAPAADRRTLIRRVTYDLHGLPPTPQEIDEFLADTSPAAYATLVDRLLASPRYGERWARHWLDVVHFGETHGYDKDKRRDHAWPYRDYVIRSLNDDKPYGQFVAEQIAGDVLAPDNPEGIVATGFVAAGPWDFVGHVELREGTIEKQKTRVIDRDDMVSNAMSTFVSLSAHCARCHDHPFDPIAQREYYGLQAIFAGVERGDREYLPAQQDPASAHQLVYAILPIEPRPIHVLARGEVEHPLDEATPGALSCLGENTLPFSLSDATSEGERRAALARWLADANNPLTWRSIANRVWQYHFDRGLVDTPNDFGRNGSRPSHPELLDWLAIELLENGQSLKTLHRLIVLSATYQQSSTFDERLARIDSGNRYLWHMPRRRLSAEEVRDALLFVSGKLDLTMGGPSFELYQFEDDHSPRYQYLPIDEARVWRRSIYARTVRSVPNPWFETLDCADPSLSTPVRNTTITALQALALLNNPFVVRQAEHLAHRLESEATDDADRIQMACRLLFGRVATPAEQQALTDYATRHGLANACRVIINANEFMFLD